MSRILINLRKIRRRSDEKNKWNSKKTKAEYKREGNKKKAVWLDISVILQGKMGRKERIE